MFILVSLEINFLETTPSTACLYFLLYVQLSPYPPAPSLFPSCGSEFLGESLKQS